MEWPGNIRELSNGIARHVLIGTEGAIPEDVIVKRPPLARPRLAGDKVMPLKSLAKEAIRAAERDAILEALRSNRWNRRKAAAELKISYRALIYKIRDAGFAGKRKGYASSQQGSPSALPNPNSAD